MPGRFFGVPVKIGSKIETRNNYLKFSKQEIEELKQLQSELHSLLLFYTGKVAPIIEQYTKTIPIPHPIPSKNPRLTTIGTIHPEHSSREQYEEKLAQIIKDKKLSSQPSQKLAEKLEQLSFPEASYISPNINSLIRNLSLEPNFFRVYGGNYQLLWQDMNNASQFLLEIIKYNNA